jgi:signal transduction histidine kinase
MRQDLTHNITHELKTPISVAVAANDALRNFSADSDPKRRRRYLDITALQLGQLSKMVEHILAASLENGDRKQLTIERFWLGALLEELQQGAELRSEKQVSLRVEIKEDMYIRADRFHLSNILSTIIDNSIKYSAESVNITLRAYFSGKACVIEIEDDGLGMEQKHLKHIFEKFYRIPKGNVQEVRGFGLGLYYSKLIVERHGGTINATSRKGEGTTIKITLPEDEREEN